MRYRKGFSLLELIVVLTVIGVIGTLGYKKYSEVMENSKAEQYLDAFKKAEMANSKVMAYAGTIRPAPINDTGDYQNDDTARCFDFKAPETATNYTAISASGSTTTDPMDDYGKTFHKSLYDELKNVGFKDKTNGGLYVQSDPRSVFYSCDRNGVRFFAIQNVKGSMALKILKLVNNGLAPSDVDGKVADKRLAIWKQTSTNIYQHIKDDNITETSTPITVKSTGDASPYTDVDAIEKAPNLTITFNLTKGTASKSKW